jgi:hypothetical protein
MADQPPRDNTSDAEEHWFDSLLKDAGKVADGVGKFVGDLGKAALDLVTTDKSDSRPADAGGSSSASDGFSKDSDSYADHSSSFDSGGGGGYSGF